MAVKNVAVLSNEYGGLELRQLYQKHARKAQTFAVGAHLFFLAAYFASNYLLTEDAPVYSVRILKYSDLGPPPSINNSQAAPAVQVASASARPTVGVPVPVPDAEISPEATIQTQQEMSADTGPMEGLGDGLGDIKIEDEGPPPDFVPVEKNPVPIKQVQPAYPEIARRAGVEGTVWVKIWVDKEGKAKKADIIKSDAELFNEPAKNAAMQWLFTPAIMNNGPVAVWVSIPFKFKLNQGR